MSAPGFSGVYALVILSSQMSASSRMAPAAVSESSSARASLSMSGFTLGCSRLTVFGLGRLMCISAAIAPSRGASSRCWLAMVSVACLRHCLRLRLASNMCPVRVMVLLPCGIAVPGMRYSYMFIPWFLFGVFGLFRLLLREWFVLV